MFIFDLGGNACNRQTCLSSLTKEMKTDNNLLVGKKNMSMRNFDPGGGTIA